MKAYKFLRRDGTGVFTRHPWPLPQDGAPGAWVEAPLVPFAGRGHGWRVKTPVPSARRNL